MRSSVLRRELLGLGVALVAFLALAVTAFADTWSPPLPFRAVDAEGDHHVNLSSDGHFVYARRGPGATPLEAAHGAYDGDVRDVPFPVRDEDVVIARGALPQRPVLVHVSTRGRGFVAIDRYAALGHGDVVVVVDAHGNVTHRLTLPDLFPKIGTDRFVRTVSSIHWRRGSWLDDARGVVVLVAAGGQVRCVDTETGKVSEGGTVDLLRALDHPEAKARDLALDVLRDREVPGLDASLVRLLEDAAQPLGTRLRAAVMLCERGDTRGRELVVAAARPERDSAVSMFDHAYAVANLPAVLGDDALPLLREAMRGKADVDWPNAQRAFVSMGERAIPTLLEMLAENDESPDYRGGAAHALKDIGSRQALASLLAAVSDESGYVANAAVNAAIAIGGDDCAGSLVHDLRRGCTQDARIAMFFCDVRFPDAVPALEAALARTDDDFARRRIEEALAYQRADDASDE